MRSLGSMLRSPTGPLRPALNRILRGSPRTRLGGLAQSVLRIIELDLVPVSYCIMVVQVAGTNLKQREKTCPVTILC